VDVVYEGSQAPRIYKYNIQPSRSHLLSNIRYARAPTAARQKQNARYEYYNSDFIAGTVFWGHLLLHDGPCRQVASICYEHTCVHNQGSSMKLIIHVITGITGVSEFVSNMDKQ
jgi:hypothetical protein